MQIVCCSSDYQRAINSVNNWDEHAVDAHAYTIVLDSEEYPLVEDSHYPLYCGVSKIDKLGPVGSLQNGYAHFPVPQYFKDISVLAFIHDDVEIYEDGWDERVLREFDEPTVGVVGFGGATGLGTPGLYKTPYRLQQLARTNYASNVTDAEVHGSRFTGERDVAVLDGFSMIVRRELLDKVGGWPVDHLAFHCYDTWLCCMARRHGYRTRLVGVRCHHFGGQTSTTSVYNEWLKKTFG